MPRSASRKTAALRKRGFRSLGLQVLQQTHELIVRTRDHLRRSDPRTTLAEALELLVWRGSEMVLPKNAKHPEDR